MTITRMGSAYAYDRTINNITKQQAELNSQMEHASAGKRVIRASDDPVAAAQAERSRTRISRLETDQRALDAQVSSMSYAETTLGSVSDALQKFRELVVQAGNAAYDGPQRDSIVQQMQSLREQILSYANRQDSNGLPLFRGLDSQSTTAFPNASSTYFQSGQANGGEYSISNALDGGLAFFSGRTGNGVLQVSLDPNNTGKVWADVGSVFDANAAAQALVANPVTRIQFTVDAAGKTTYSLYDDTGTRLNDSNGNPLPDYDYTAGNAISVAGMNLTLKGTPSNGDALVLDGSKTISVFDVMDNAIASLKSNNSGPKGTVEHSVARALQELDTSMNRVSTVRGLAGDLLNQADRMTDSITTRSDLMEGQRSAAEDIDMVKAISDLSTQQTAVSTALQAYSSIQKLSLFNYIN